MQKTAKTISLSASSLKTFTDCPCCFWNEKKKKIVRPRGIFPALPGGMDRIIKAHFDRFRVLGEKPAELNHPTLAEFDLLIDLDRLKAWRQWNAKEALKVVTPKWTLVCGFDDVLYRLADECYAPLDFKTTGSSEKERTQEDAEKYYLLQQDICSLVLEENNFKTAGFGAVILYAPLNHHPKSMVEFLTQVFILETDIYRAKSLCDRAAECLESDIEPPANPDCQYCNFVAKRLPQ